MSQSVPINRTPAILVGLASCRVCRGLIGIAPDGRRRFEIGPRTQKKVLASIGRWQLAEMAAAAPTMRGLREAGRLVEPRFAGDRGGPREHDCHEIEAGISGITHCDCPACRGESAPSADQGPSAPPRYAWLDQVLKEWIVFRREELAEHRIEVRLDFSLAAPVVYLTSGGLTESLLIAAPAHKAGEFDAIAATAIDAALTRLLALLKDRDRGGEP
ncbi:MAG: hypothetical protein AB7W06_17350 [Alphaproteobacteria bacterium]